MVWYGSYGLIALHSHCGGLDDLAPTWECRLKVLDQSAAFNEAACKVVGLQRLSPCIAQARIEGVWQIPAVASLHRAEIANGGLDLLAALVVDAFAETGGSAALSGAAQSNDLRTATFGLRGTYTAGTTTLSGSAAWLHSAGDLSAPTTLSMAGVDTPYEVNSAALDQNAIELAAQASIQLSSGAVLAGGYSGMIGKTNSTHGLRVTLSMAW